MKQTRVFQVLSQLSIPELNRFKKFLDSPYFNVNKNLNILFEQCYNAIKSEKAVLSKPMIWALLFESVPYNDVKFRKLCNDLLSCFEHFLVIEKVESDHLEQTTKLVEAIRDKGLDELYEKHKSKSQKIFDRNLERSASFFLERYSFNKILQNLISNYEKKVNISKYFNAENFNKLNYDLDAFYVIEKLRLAIDIDTWSKQYKSEAKVYTDEVLRIIDSNETMQNEFAIETYLNLYNLFTKENSVASYDILKSLFLENLASFPQDEQREIFDALFSFCVREVNKGNDKFLEEYLFINELGISEGLILKNGYLSPTSFRNYVVGGLRFGDYDRVENYILKNSELIEESKRENAYNFNMARLEFYRKEFITVVKLLQKVNYDDIWYNINSKLLLMATYYELEEFDVLFSLIDSYSSFLRREKSLDEARKTRHQNFISFLKKISSSNTKLKLKELRVKAKNNHLLVNKEWLLEKIDELL